MTTNVVPRIFQMTAKIQIWEKFTRQEASCRHCKHCPKKHGFNGYLLKCRHFKGKAYYNKVELKLNMWSNKEGPLRENIKDSFTLCDGFSPK